MVKETVTLKIPGLTGTYTFFQTSDAHVAIEADTTENAPARAFLEAIRTAKEEKADGIFLCGDIGDNCTDSTMQFLHEALENAGTEVFYVMGNHEVVGTPDKGKAKNLFTDLMFGNTAFWVRDLGELLIVGIDNSDKYYTDEQLAFLQEQTAKNKPIILLMHDPLMTDGIIDPVKEMWSEEMGAGACQYFLIDRPANTGHPLRRFWDLVQDPENRVAAIFAGHVHLSSESEFAPGKKQYTMTPTYMGNIRKVIVAGE